MPVIPYEATGFSSGWGVELHGEHSLDVTWFDLVWGAVSVGRAGLDDMLAYGPFSVDEIRYRVFFVAANLWENDTYIYKSPAYDNLAPTEKGAISYFLGMALGKLCGLFLLDAPWLVHLDKLLVTHGVVLSGRSRPDLAGLDTLGRWVIMEAKGRTGAFSNAALVQAKAQVTQIGSIEGQNPHVRVALEMYFDDYLLISLMDPEDFTFDLVNLDISPSDLMRMYYKPFIRLLERRGRTDQLEGRAYCFVDYPWLGVSIGVRKDLTSILESDAPLLKMRSEKGRKIVSEIPKRGRGYAVYPDGLAIGLDKRWTKESMERKPTER